MAEKPNIFVAQISSSQGEKLREDLIQKGFSLASPPPPYSVFSAKKTGLSCTLYTSGKLVIQGKNIKEFIEFYLEPEVLETLSFTHPEVKVNMQPHIGIDESGKGDLFGPLCTAGVYATAEQIQALLKLGVCDSKKLNDISITKLAPQIQNLCAHHIIKVTPKRYNELYAQFRNLNHLLAWTHATAIEALVTETHCLDVMVDQFAAEHVVETALKRKLLSVNLTQQHRAEQDVVVAAASILARYAFISGLHALSQEFGIVLPKGAGAQTITAAKTFVQRHGKEALPFVSKMHFKSHESI
ncbi:MAG: ribonuclease HIII [Parachlamydiales bacterium]|jgi:ribonuclease HIII